MGGVRLLALFCWECDRGLEGPAAEAGAWEWRVCPSIPKGKATMAGCSNAVTPVLLAEGCAGVGGAKAAPMRGVTDAANLIRQSSPRSTVPEPRSWVVGVCLLLVAERLQQHNALVVDQSDGAAAQSCTQARVGDVVQNADTRCHEPSSQGAGALDSVGETGQRERLPILSSDGMDYLYCCKMEVRFSILL